jgi:subtilisin family serine protease
MPPRENSSSDNDQNPFYPAGYECQNIVSIGASDREDARASFSSYGKTTVDLFAPGVDILSAAPGSSYRTLSGTSMATPHVSGAVALLLSGAGNLAPASVRQMLIESCDPSSSLTKYCVSGGRLNTEKLIVSACPSPTLDIASVAIEGGNATGLPSAVKS